MDEILAAANEACENCEPRIRKSEEETFTMEVVNNIRLSIDYGSADAFIEMLDAEKIQHSRIICLSTEAPIVEMISKHAKAPWVAFSKLLITWMNLKKSREVIITTGDNKVIHLKGYSAKDAEKIINHALNVSIIERKTEEDENTLEREKALD